MAKPGRQKGSKNIKVGRFVAELVANRKNFDPLEMLIDIARGDWEALGYKEKTYSNWTAAGLEFKLDNISLQERNKAAKEVAKYLYSAKQSVEIGNKDGEGFEIIFKDYCSKK